MAYLLNAIYLLLLAAASPWLVWQAWRTGKYRGGWGAKLLGRVPRRNGNGPCLWLHAVSVGEVNLLATLIERWERRHPQWEIVISTTTLTGFQLATKRYAPRTVFYCPLDLTWAASRAMRRGGPGAFGMARAPALPATGRGTPSGRTRPSAVAARQGLGLIAALAVVRMCYDAPWTRRPATGQSSWRVVRRPPVSAAGLLP